MSDFKFNCPYCDQHLEASDEMVGQIVDCPICDGQMTIPEPDNIATAPQANASRDCSSLSFGHHEGGAPRPPSELVSVIKRYCGSIGNTANGDEEHQFNEKGICVVCGCSKAFVKSSSGSCRPMGATVTKSTASERAENQAEVHLDTYSTTKVSKDKYSGMTRKELRFELVNLKLQLRQARHRFTGVLSENRKRDSLYRVARLTPILVGLLAVPIGGIAKNCGFDTVATCFLVIAFFGVFGGVAGLVVQLPGSSRPEELRLMRLPAEITVLQEEIGKVQARLNKWMLFVLLVIFTFGIFLFLLGLVISESMGH